MNRLLETIVGVPLMLVMLAVTIAFCIVVAVITVVIWPALIFAALVFPRQYDEWRRKAEQS